MSVVVESRLAQEAVNTIKFLATQTTTEDVLKAWSS